MKFLLSIENWKIENPQKLSEYIKSRKNWLYSLVLKKYWTRSLAQNSYYREDLHYYFKHRFIDWEAFPSSRELNKNEFAEYVDKIRDFASAELGIYIPDAQK